MAASLGKPSSEINPEHKLRLAVRHRARARQGSAIGENDSARGLVVYVAGDLEPSHPDLACHRQHQPQGPGRIAAPPLPRHDRIADMARYVIRDIVAARHEAEVDGAAEVAVVEPEHGSREARHLPSRGLSEYSILAGQLGQERGGIEADRG